MYCPLCSNRELRVVDVQYPFFRHLDFETVRESGTVGECSACQLLWNVDALNGKTGLESVFASREYSRGGLISHTVRVEGQAVPVRRSYLQAELLRPYFPTRGLRVLDVGCFDGELLVELDSRFEGATLVGFDINKHLRLDFPAADNFQFRDGELEGISGQFDLICLSSSMMYFQDIDRLMRNIKRLLGPDGMVYVHVADLSKNAFSLLAGDQFFYYTYPILSNIFAHSGFSLARVENDWFPRDVVAVATTGKSSGNCSGNGGTVVDDCLRNLGTVCRGLIELPASTTNRVGVLGTTWAAAFADSVLGTRISFFVDENPDRMGRCFRGRNVLHPRSLDAECEVIIPFGSHSQTIKDRLSANYRGRYVAV